MLLIVSRSAMSFFGLVSLGAVNDYTPTFSSSRCRLTSHLTETMDQGRKVWAPDAVEGFQLGEICDFGTDTISVQPLSGGKVCALFSFVSPDIFHRSRVQVVEAAYDAVYPAEDDDAKPQEDNCLPSHPDL